MQGWKVIESENLEIESLSIANYFLNIDFLIDEMLENNRKKTNKSQNYFAPLQNFRTKFLKKLKYSRDCSSKLISNYRNLNYFTMLMRYSKSK